MSSEKINRAIETKVKHVFKTCLRGVEIRFGVDFDGYDQLRAEILRVGNNAIRELKELIYDELGEDIEESFPEVRIRNRRD